MTHTPNSLCHRIATLTLALPLLLGLAGCGTASLKDERAPKVHSVALPPADSGLLADIAREISAEYGEDHSGFRILDRNFDGLYWRLALIDSATTSLDIQTYLWYPDVSGRLILERAVLASQRGVKVRLIVDDLILQGHDQLIANLHAQPNIEFRLFNPWEDRQSLIHRAGEMLASMERLNTRMHDKLMIVDGRAAVVGGRNIGDHYFGLHATYNFHDTDLLGIGHIAQQANEMFDMFWNSDWVASADDLSTEYSAETAAQQWQNLKVSSRQAPELEAFPREVRDWNIELRAYAAELRPGTSTLVFDETENDEIDQSVISSMFNFFSLAEEELLIMNAYVIPAQQSVDFLQRQIEAGVRTTIFTNSLASHDVPAVNSHYGPWRDDFLEAGVKLYEFKPNPAIQSEVVDVAPINAEFSGLHSKTAVADRRHVFIGSMNLDPRSARINTEMGAIVDSPALARDMAAIIERNMDPANSWKLVLDEDGDVTWVDADTVLETQPARDNLQRIMDVIMKAGPRDQF